MNLQKIRQMLARVLDAQRADATRTQAAIAALSHEPRRRRPRRQLTAQGRARIAAAQRARWARVRATKKGK